MKDGGIQAGDPCAMPLKASGMRRAEAVVRSTLVPQEPAGLRSQLDGAGGGW